MKSALMYTMIGSLLSGIFLFAGCNKKDMAPTNQTKPNPQFTVNGGMLWQWDPSCNCYVPGNNCSDDIVITSLSNDAYVAFKNAVASGPSAIGTYFTSGSWATVFPDLADPSGATYLHELQSGTYSIHTITEGSTIYYLAGTGTFDATDPEFVLQVTE